MDGAAISGTYRARAGPEAIARAIRTGTKAFGEPVAVLLDRDAAIRAGGFDADWKYCVDIDFGAGCWPTAMR